MEVLSFSSAKEKLGCTEQGEYLYRYLDDLNAKTAVVEDNYIDKDYLIDYSNFYARSFKNYERHTTRLHFFTEEFTEEKFKENFHSNKEFQGIISNSYLGFIVVKPIGYSEKNKLIGRTLLQTYPYKADDCDARKFTKFKHDVSLCGIKLTVESLPYQMQDSIVAACATTAIWTSLSALNSLFGTSKQSPFEITKTSVYFPGVERNFPNSSGLTLFQIKEYFNSTGLETECINVENNPEVIKEVIKAHLNFGLPIIACIRLTHLVNNTQDLHAVVISGYRSNKSGEITELYLHDDGIGPYCRTTSVNDKTFLFWKNEWTDLHNYNIIKVEKLLIPLYPKIRYSFNRVYKIFFDIKQISDKKGYVSKLFLSELNQYKGYLLTQSFHDKAKILMTQLPKYIWVIRIENNELPEIDVVLDATSVFQVASDKLCEIKYIH